MKKIILFIYLFVTIAAAQYAEGQFIDDIVFTDSDVDLLSNIIYTQQSTKELISSGKVVLISFFNPG